MTKKEGRKAAWLFFKFAFVANFICLFIALFYLIDPNGTNETIKELIQERIDKMKNKNDDGN